MMALICKFREDLMPVTFSTTGELTDPSFSGLNLGLESSSKTRFATTLLNKHNGAIPFSELGWLSWVKLGGEFLVRNAGGASMTGR
jgi:hypothetical protein